MLQLAEGFALPDDAATRRLAIVAMSGAGKSNAAVRLAEEMHREGIPWVAVDPKGDWFGVRSNAAGDGPGLPVPVFGGLHGDVPLDPRSGKLVAEVIADSRLTCVLDVSEFTTRQAMWGFLADFGEELYRRNRSPLHLFLDEADEYIPQTTREKGNLPRCLGVWDRVVRRGRFRGLGATLITQRSATLNKDVLYMAECLVALRTGGPRNKGDRQTIAGWFDANTALGDAGRIIDALPGLEDGEAFVSSPSWLRLEEPLRVQLYRRETYDSGKTPGVGEDVLPPATLADVDLEALRARMAMAVEQAEANDPTKLKVKVAELERALRARPAEVVACDHEAELAELRAHLERLEANNRALAFATADAQRWRDVARRIASQASGMTEEIEIALSGPVPEEYMAAAHALEVRREQTRQGDGAPRRIDRAKPVATTGERYGLRSPSPVPSSAGAQDTSPSPITAYERDLLNAAALRHPATSTRRQLSLLSGRSHKSSQFGPALRSLIAAGYLEVEGSAHALTPAGLAEVPDAQPPAAGDLVGWWRSRLSAYEAAQFDVVVLAQPDPVSREDIATRAGQSLRSSQFAPTLRDLVDKGLLVTPSQGYYAAAPELFETVPA